MNRLLDAFALIGRYGTQGFVAAIALGLAVPQVAAAARPLLGVCIFSFLVITFARADLAQVRRLLRQPARLAVACLWLFAAPALISGAALALIGRDGLDPGLVLGLALLGAAPPLLSGPAVAILLGFEPTLLLSATVIATMLSPLVSPLVADLIAGAAVPLDATVLALRLAVFIGGAIVCGLSLRWLAGEDRLTQRRRSLDGISVLLYVTFAVAAMDGVTQAAIARPALVAAFLAMTFAIALIGLLSTWLCLPFVPDGDRFTLAYGTGHRNMGLLVAALGASVPDTTFLFFALAQVPIYLMPQALKPVAKRILAKAR
jgi:bile acid:Na+ symporter, BASS family